MEPLTYNRKDTAAVLGISTLTVDDLERRGKLHRLPAFAVVRYSLKEIEQIAGAQGGKTLREKELERQLAEKDERIEQLTRYIIENGIIANYAGRNA